MSDVTYSRKRYVSVCAGCDLLFDTVRRDQITCSPACRVKAHRSGIIKERRALADRLHIDAAGIGHGAAISLLRPDFEANVMSGEVTFDQIMPDVCIAFDKLLIEAVRLSRKEDAT